MAEWKKIIVSGSHAHLASVTASNLTNNNILVAGTGGALESSGITYDGLTLALGASAINSTGATSLLSGSFSGSFSGDGTGLTGVVADSFDFDSLTAGTSIAQGDHLAFSDSGTEKKITFSNLEDAIFANISGDATVAAGGALTIAADSVEGTMLNTNAADTTTIELSSDTLSVLKVPNALTDTAGGGLTDFSFDGSGAVNIAVSGASALSTNGITKWSGDAFVDSSLTDNGSAITGTTSIQLTGTSSNLSGSFSGSFQGDGGSLTGIATTLNVTDGSNPQAINLQSETLTFAAANANEITVSTSTADTVTIGLPDDVTIGNNLTVTGDLVVNGDQTILSVTNLAVDDKFIMLNSGSTTAGDESGIVFGGSNGSANEGAALIWNGDYNSNDGRLAVANSVNGSATSASPNYFLAGVFTGSAAGAATVQADHPGNIRVDGSDIYIYV